MNKRKGKGPKVYIYGILDDTNTIIYIGKSWQPSKRLTQHKSTGYLKCKILDIYYDVEKYWIDKCLDEGLVLENKTPTFIDVEEHEIGDIIDISDKCVLRHKIKNIDTNKIYPTIQSLCDDIGAPRWKVKAQLDSDTFVENFPYEYYRE